MADSLNPDPDAALARLRDIALGLPETEERPSHGQPTFFVAGKMFAQFRHDHHGDGRTVVAVKAGDSEEARALIEAAPERYARVAYLSSEWIGVAIGSDPDWTLVCDRVAHSWELAAPRGLLEAGGR
jgi:hypothetical protein